MTRTIVHIDSLVLKGFRHEDRHAIAAGLRQELAGMFADPRAVQQWIARGDVARLRIGSVLIDPSSKPQRVGAQAARGIGMEMKKK